MPHASPERLHGIFKAVGAPVQTLGDSLQVVRGCKVSGTLQTQGNKNIPTVRPATNFNENAQMDLTFYHSMLEHH